MRLAIKLIGIVALVVVILVSLLYFTEMPNDRNNGFNRNWYDSERIVEINRIDLPEQLSSIVGVSDNSIFIGSDNFRGTVILSKDFTYKDTLMLGLQLEPEKMIPFRLEIDTPMLYLHLNNLPAIVYGRFPNDSLKLVSIETGIFTKSIQISENTAIVRTLDSTFRNQIFKKVNIKSGEVIIQSDFIGQKDNSAGLSSEGILLYDKVNASLVYTEYFKNSIYVIDTNLNVILKGQTIDTFGVNDISLAIGQVKDSMVKLEPNSARMQVNKSSFIGSGKLFVLSGIKSDDQRLIDFNRNLTFDVYDCHRLNYQGSLRIKRKEGEKFKAAVVFNDTLAVLSDKELVMYKIRN